ncbi:hypothetical protein DFJ58DRAFT_914588 [Suillus subalutaceus]|uniref:uncharacterized protein n=1 Tax=Suillus subalutaceus TaxID=48586 RepID=UPI001B86C7CB|nr:uncharacterized protein DFJ58DRAFT_914588 [Suillus subalutaceus]KAG1851041.1 hypothetical protein DFJ58DRAFT_914588 [Suillus subalutaceus]
MSDLVSDDSINIAPKDDRNGLLVLVLCGFAEVNHAPVDACDMAAGFTWEDALQTGERFLELCLAFGFGIRTSCLRIFNKTKHTNVVKQTNVALESRTTVIHSILRLQVVLSLWPSRDVLNPIGVDNVLMVHVQWYSVGRKGVSVILYLIGMARMIGQERVRNFTTMQENNCSMELRQTTSRGREGEYEISDALKARANHLTQIGDKEGAVAAQKLALEKTPGLTSRIDIVLTVIRLGFFFGDNSLITENLPRAENSSRRVFMTGGALLLDALSTFTATELTTYNDFVALKKRLITAPEVISVLPEVPILGDHLNNLYDFAHLQSRRPNLLSGLANSAQTAVSGSKTSSIAADIAHLSSKPLSPKPGSAWRVWLLSWINHASQLAEQHGTEIASDVVAWSRHLGSMTYNSGVVNVTGTTYAPSHGRLSINPSLVRSHHASYTIVFTTWSSSSSVNNVKVKEDVNEDDPRKRRARTLGQLGRGTFGPPPKNHGSECANAKSQILLTCRGRLWHGVRWVCGRELRWADMGCWAFETGRERDLEDVQERHEARREISGKGVDEKENRVNEDLRKCDLESLWWEWVQLIPGGRVGGRESEEWVFGHKLFSFRPGDKISGAGASPGTMEKKLPPPPPLSHQSEVFGYSSSGFGPGDERSGAVASYKPIE